MEISTAQSELRRAYLRGGPGAIVAGVVWLIAGITGLVSGVAQGFAVLFFGGMFIFPVTALFLRTILRRGVVRSENPGGLTVIETVIPMISGLFAAWLLLPFRPEFVFPVAAIAVGAHYFGFRSAYGDWTNWILGGIMCMVGMMSLGSNQVLGYVPFVIAAVEVGFGLWLSWRSVVEDRASESA